MMIYIITKKETIKPLVIRSRKHKYMNYELSMEATVFVPILRTGRNSYLLYIFVSVSFINNQI